MDRDTAHTILIATLGEYRRLSYQQLVERIGAVHTREVAAPDGTRFQLEIQVFWDGKAGGDVRVLGSIDDRRGHAFYPLTHDFVAGPGAQEQPMKSKDERAREIQRAIGEVLLRNWDPIGVGDQVRVQDEYDAYIGDVYRLIASGASARQLAEHLARIEAEQLGNSDTEPEMLIPVAEKLLRLHVKLNAGGPAV